MQTPFQHLRHQPFLSPLSGGPGPVWLLAHVDVQRWSCSQRIQWSAWDCGGQSSLRDYSWSAPILFPPASSSAGGRRQIPAITLKRAVEKRASQTCRAPEGPSWPAAKSADRQPVGGPGEKVGESSRLLSHPRGRFWMNERRGLPLIVMFGCVGRGAPPWIQTHVVGRGCEAKHWRKDDLYWATMATAHTLEKQQHGVLPLSDQVGEKILHTDTHINTYSCCVFSGLAWRWAERITAAHMMIGWKRGLLSTTVPP